VPELEQAPDTRRLGVGAVRTLVSDLRPNADLAVLGLRKGDRILRVDGRRVFDSQDVLEVLAESAGTFTVQVERDGSRVELAGADLDRARRIALARDVALVADESRVEVVLSARAAVEGQLRDGDRVLAVNGVEAPRWTEQFLPIVQQAAKENESVQLRIAREHDDGRVEELGFTIAPGPVTVANYGLGPREAVYEYRAGSVGEALDVGMQGTWRFATDTWQTIKRMVLGHVSSKNMGGIISIGMMSYTQAEEGLAKLLFFLCLLSMNLAIINVLPIPLLDGGHLFFLLIEKIKGSPVSERVFGYSQVVGLVLILTLVIYVTYNDLRRFDWIP
jgi:regulator of sigma E protease